MTVILWKEHARILNQSRLKTPRTRTVPLKLCKIWHQRFKQSILLYSQFVWHCKSSRIAPLSNYANNPMFQELPTKSEYFTIADEKIFINLRRGRGYTDKLGKLNRDDTNLTITINLKAAATRKMRLHVIGYFQGECLYLLLREQEYSANRQKKCN